MKLATIGEPTFRALTLRYSEQTQPHSFFHVETNLLTPLFRNQLFGYSLFLLRVLVIPKKATPPIVKKT